MKKTILALLALACVTAQAQTNDCIAFRQNVTLTRTGNGLMERARITGWLFLDGKTLDFALLEIDNARKRFTVEQPAFTMQTVFAPRGKSYSILTIDEGNLSGLTIKGLNRTIDLFVNDVYQIPGSATASGSILFQNGEQFYFDEYRGSYVYDKRTTQSPTIHETPLEKIERLKADLILKGFLEE